MVGGYTYYELHEQNGWPVAPALIGTLVAGAVIGVRFHYLIMRPMREASPIGGAVITQDRIYLFVIGLVVTIALWLIYKYTRFGQATSAVAENERAAASMGHSPDAIAALNWVIGSSLATVTGALIAPITFLQPTQTSQLILPALAGALLGGFASFPLAFVAAMIIGMGQSILTFETSSHGWWTGWSQSLPFLLVIAYLVLRGRGIPLRSHIFDRLPKIGTGHIRIIPVIVLALAGVVLVSMLPQEWSIAFTVTVCFAIICLSVVVVTGYCGQLSLAQYVIGAMGAFVAAKLMQDQNTPFSIAFIIGIAAAMVIGLLLGAPALPTRGINLAVTTLGVGISLYSLFLTNIKLVGSLDGIPIKAASIFGINLDPSTYPRRYGYATVIVLVLLCIMVANLRRGVSGRRLLAVRSNERAALALGVSVYTAKLYAFMVSAGIAAVGVSILAFINPKVVFSGFDVFTSIGFITSTVVGIFEQDRAMGAAIRDRFRGGRTAGPAGPAETPAVTPNRIPVRMRRTVEAERREIQAVAVPPKPLVVEGVTVRFGGVVAVNNMSLTVRPGTVHGLIGPNGAGKTTFIDAVTGFVRASGGSITLDGAEINHLAARRRVGRGLARSFQSGELFNDLTIRENLAVGSDDAALGRYVTDLVWPGPVTMSDAAIAAAREFHLDTVYDLKLEALPFGRRRLVASPGRLRPRPRS